MILLVLLALGGCVTVPDNGRQGSSDLLEARKLLRAGDYEQAIQRLETLKTRSERGSDVQQARLDLMYARYKRGNYTEARREAEEFIQAHPTHPKAAYAYYMRGLASHEQARQGLKDVRGSAALEYAGRARQAFQHFAALLRRYPESPYTEDAVQRMVELRDELGRHELRLAEQRMAQRDYAEAADRARYVVEHYTGGAAVPDALALLVRAYRATGKEQAAETALRMLDANHPEHPALEKLRKSN